MYWRILETILYVSLFFELKIHQLIDMTTDSTQRKRNHGPLSEDDIDISQSKNVPHRSHPHSIAANTPIAHNHNVNNGKIIQF